VAERILGSYPRMGENCYWLATREDVVMYVEPIRRARCDHHHGIANELRLIVLRMKHPEAAEELRVLADAYEKLP